MNWISDPTWGCDHIEFDDLTGTTVRVCLVKVNDVSRLATELAEVVANTSWMMDLDRGTRRSYEKAVSETAELLQKIFATVESNVSLEFGEIMVSRGSVRALEVLFGHQAIPLAELWKPRAKQNEGFDFHTICANPYVNFGEAKYSGIKNPHGLAIDQIDGFLVAEKHLRDRVHLVSLCPAPSIASLDDDQFGVVAAFSINGLDKAAVLKNARDAAEALATKHGVKQVFVVGVVHEAS